MFIVLIASQALLQNFVAHPSHFTVAAYNTGMRPGMQLRVEQRTIDSFKRAMESFLPHYFNFDMNFPSEYHYHFSTFFDMIAWEFDWNNIKYSHAELDIADTVVAFEDHIDQHVLRVRFPAVKHWEISANQHVNNIILPDQSNI